MAKRVLIWNLETFGNQMVGDAVGAGIKQNLLAALIHDLDADVVLIQELRSRGVGWLENVRARLEQIQTAARQWQFDWIKGGISDGVSLATVGYAQTTFNATNSEGYAVLWRDTCLQPQGGNRSAGAGNTNTSARTGAPSYIELCLRGYEMTTVEQEKESRLAQAAGPVIDPTSLSGFPLHCGSATVPYRPQDDRDSAPKWEEDEDVQVIKYSRRAVYVTVNDGGTLVDVLGYHAPNAECSTLYGPLIAFNALTPTMGRRIIAGDWNTTTTRARKVLATDAVKPAYGLTSPLLNAAGTCAGLETMVHASPKKDSKKWLSHDGVFTNHRDFGMLMGAGNLAVPDLRALFYQPAVPTTRDQTYRQLIKSKGSIKRQLTKSGSHPAKWPETSKNGWTNKQIVMLFCQYFQTYTGPLSTDEIWNNTGNKASFSTAFALLYNRYVSDHLPILATF